ncbi:BatA domain-containing protein, partial [Singulisphaera rosea]
TKLETGRRQLVETLKTLGSGRWVLVDGSSSKAREVESPDALLNATSLEGTSASSDLPGMLLVARDYLKVNKSGQAEVWICSDLRENDWNAEDGRWKTLRDAFLEFSQGVRFHLLAYPQIATTNLSVRVTDVRRQESGDAAELLVSLRLVREGGGDEKAVVPVHFDIGGARSEVTVEMAGARFDLKDHRIPLEKGHVRGWGRVSIPADANHADNYEWFVFDRPVPRKAIVVADDPQVARPLQLAAGVAPAADVTCSAETVTVEQLSAVEWDTVALLLWQAPLPEGEAAKLVRSFVERGGRVIFFPPRSPGASELYGVRWGSWVEPDRALVVENWLGDQDLLAHTLSGSALPVGTLQVKKYCGLTGEFTTLATLRGGVPLLARV